MKIIILIKADILLYLFKKKKKLKFVNILGEYPIGQEVEYDGRMGKQRITSEEKRAIERSKYDDYNDARRAAEAHRQVT